MIGYIYRYRNKINSKVYIGQTINIEKLNFVRIRVQIDLIIEIYQISEEESIINVRVKI